MAETGRHEAPSPLVETSWLSERLDNPDVRTLDCSAVFESTGALKTDRAITYCGGGVAASLDALALTILGVPHVAVYHGSMAEWNADPTLPMETDCPMTLEPGRPRC